VIAEAAINDVAIAACRLMPTTVAIARLLLGPTRRRLRPHRRRASDCRGQLRL
jgi:hypothetical protein